MGVKFLRDIIRNPAKKTQEYVRLFLLSENLNKTEVVFPSTITRYRTAFIHVIVQIHNRNHRKNLWVSRQNRLPPFNSEDAIPVERI